MANNSLAHSRGLDACVHSSLIAGVHCTKEVGSGADTSKPTALKTRHVSHVAWRLPSLSVHIDLVSAPVVFERNVKWLVNVVNPMAGGTLRRPTSSPQMPTATKGSPSRLQSRSMCR